MRTNTPWGLLQAHLAQAEHSKTVFTENLSMFYLLGRMFLRAGRSFLAMSRLAAGLSRAASEGVVVTNPQRPAALCLTSWAGRLACAFRVRYCQLNRKLRKIVKNKYKFQKKYEYIQPYRRLGFILALLKRCLSVRPELTFFERVSAFLVDLFSDPSSSIFHTLLHQTQAITLDTLRRAIPGR